jgi:membrane associated rhomboid family serine protease
MYVAKVVFARSMGIDLDRILGLHYITSTDFKPYQFITYLFMHGDEWHLFFNMFAVWMFGSVLENVWGAKRFIFYYLITGVGAALIQYVIYYFQIQDLTNHFNSLLDLPDYGANEKAELLELKRRLIDRMVIIGASGSLFGILLAFGMMFPNTELYLYFLVPLKAKWFVIGYGAIELFLGIKNNPMDNVAHFAHLGGMLFGFIVIMIWKKNRNFYY